MGLKHSIRQIAKLAQETGSEISFSDTFGVDWYWKNLRFQPDESEVPKLVEAIKTLQEIGFEDS
jgi:hypothetical protein